MSVQVPVQLDSNSKVLPRWFWVVSWISLVWNLMGVAAFLGQITMDTGSLSNAEPPEKRAHKRIAFVQEVEAEGLGTRRCSDLSEGGLYLETDVSFPIDTIVDLRFKLLDSDADPIRVQARVFYIHPTIGLGLQFTNLSDEDRERIKKFVDAR